VTPVGQAHAVELGMARSHFLQGFYAEDVRQLAADRQYGNDSKLGPDRPQGGCDRIGTGRPGQALENCRIEGRDRTAGRIFGIGAARKGIPVRAAIVGKGMSIDALGLLRSISPGGDVRRCSQGLSQPVDPSRRDLGANIVEDDAWHPRRLRRAEQHRNKPTHRCADQRHLRDSEPIEKAGHIPGVDRDLIVGGIRIPWRLAAAPLVGDDDPVVRRQVLYQRLEVPTIACQSVQTQHGERRILRTILLGVQP